jgi:hypothetical protein
MHWKIMLISGMGFFTDAYDLFIIGVVMPLEERMVDFADRGGSRRVDRAARLSLRRHPLRRIADMLGRKRIYGCEVLVLFWRGRFRAVTWRLIFFGSFSASGLAAIIRSAPLS